MILHKLFTIEINTIPGSFSYYLWEASGVQYTDLIDDLIEEAKRRFKEENKIIESFVSLLWNQ